MALPARASTAAGASSATDSARNRMQHLSSVRFMEQQDPLYVRANTTRGPRSSRARTRKAGHRVVRDRFPHGGGRHVRARARADAGVAVERAPADAHELGLVRVAAEQARPAHRAEGLAPAVRRLVEAHELLACDE